MGSTKVPSTAANSKQVRMASLNSTDGRRGEVIENVGVPVSGNVVSQS